MVLVCGKRESSRVVVVRVQAMYLAARAMNAELTGGRFDPFHLALRDAQRRLDHLWNTAPPQERAWHALATMDAEQAEQRATRQAAMQVKCASYQPPRQGGDDFNSSSQMLYDRNRLCVLPPFLHITTSSASISFPPMRGR
jgi:hypothetical protein